jgi:hypothetical protein
VALKNINDQDKFFKISIYIYIGERERERERERVSVSVFHPYRNGVDVSEQCLWQEVGVALMQCKGK